MGGGGEFKGVLGAARPSRKPRAESRMALSECADPAADKTRGVSISHDSPSRERTVREVVTLRRHSDSHDAPF